MLPEKICSSIKESSQFLLMQKDHQVALISWNPVFAQPLRLIDVIEASRLPLPVLYNEGQGQQYGLNCWMKYRSIPASRFQEVKASNNLSAQSPVEFSLQNFGLSLSDSYWFCPVGKGFTWDEINLFKNEFDQPLSNKSKLSDSGISPYASTNGDLRKLWRVENGTRLLYKESRTPYYQQAYNEVFASVLLDELKIPHVPYSIKDIEGTPYSVCPAFTDENTEYVPAWYILSAAKKYGNQSDYTYFLSCLSSVYPQFDTVSLHTMLAFDFLICNTDRHYGNFGFLRDVETLEWKGAAPIFDNGTSLWHDTVTHRVSRTDQECKPFFKTFEVQNFKLRSSLPAFSGLSDVFVLQAAQSIYSQNPDFDRERIAALVNAVIAGNRQLKLLHDLNYADHFKQAARQSVQTYKKRGST